MVVGRGNVRGTHLALKRRVNTELSQCGAVGGVAATRRPRTRSQIRCGSTWPEAEIESEGDANAERDSDGEVSQSRAESGAEADSERDPANTGVRAERGDGGVWFHR